MLKTFAAGLLATALIAGPAFAQTPNSSATPGSAPTASAPAKTPTAADTMKTPITSNAKQAAHSSKATKHVKLHKKTVKHVASRSHVKSGTMHQARHVKPVKSHQVKTSAAAKRS